METGPPFPMNYYSMTHVYQSSVLVVVFDCSRKECHCSTIRSNGFIIVSYTLVSFSTWAATHANVSAVDK